MKEFKDYDSFMENYRKEHEVCPTCGSTDSIQTLMAYILYIDNQDNYKDLNIAECCNCGNKHKVHDRISKKEF